MGYRQQRRSPAALGSLRDACALRRAGCGDDRRQMSTFSVFGTAARVILVGEWTLDERLDLLRAVPPR